MRGSQRAFLLLAMLNAAACARADGKNAEGKNPERAVSRDPTSESYAPPPASLGYVTLKDAFGGTHRVAVELAITPAQRERGLMWRRSLEDGKGMLFLFPSEEVQSFWMRNTLIPLDMLFLNRAHQVVGIVSRAEPKTLVARTVNRPSQFVLEVPGGWAERMGVRPGVTVQFEGVPLEPPLE